MLGQAFRMILEFNTLLIGCLRRSFVLVSDECLYLCGICVQMSASVNVLLPSWLLRDFGARAVLPKVGGWPCLAFLATLRLRSLDVFAMFVFC